MAVAQTTLGSMIASGLRKAGILARGEPMNPQDGADLQKDFIQMVDAWNNETLLIPIVSTVVEPLFANISEYTIGIHASTPSVANAHWETPRPERIISAFIRDTAGTDYIQKIFFSEEWARISRKSEGARPSKLYVRKGFPLNTIIFESLPYAEEFIHLEVVQPLSGILPALTLNEKISLPPGYERTLIYNFALEVSPEYGKDPKNFVAVTAVEGKKWLKRNNYRSIVLGLDRAIATQRKATGTYIIEQGP